MREPGRPGGQRWRRAQALPRGPCGVIKDWALPQAAVGNRAVPYRVLEGQARLQGSAIVVSVGLWWAEL